MPKVWMTDLGLSEDDRSPARDSEEVSDNGDGRSYRSDKNENSEGDGKVHSEADDTSGDDDSGNGAKTNVNTTSSCVQSIPLGA